MKQQSEHLSNAQIEQYGKRASGAGPETEAWVEQHLDDCPSCRSRVLDFQRTRFALLPDPKVNKVSSSNCPSEDDLRSLAAGLCSDPHASEFSAHAATCDRCGPLLREYQEDFSDEVTPEEQAALAQLRSSSPAWQRQKAREMLQMNNKPADSSPPSPSWTFSWKWGLAFSFVLLLIPGIIWVYPLLILHNRALAVEAEYRAGRPMKYRPAGVPYGPYRGVLGGGTAPMSAPVIDVPNRERAPLLASNADLLHGDTSDAKSTLEKALGKERPLPFLNNLAVAHAMEAEELRPASNQDREAQKKIFQKALDITGEILRRSPSDPAALFNQALILERLGNTKDAITALEQLKRVEQDAGWQEEATEELRRIQPGG